MKDILLAIIKEIAPMLGAIATLIYLHRSNVRRWEATEQHVVDLHVLINSRLEDVVKASYASGYAAALREHLKKPDAG
jgi:hypothetical protein